jgi:CxxC motif-containing protein
METRNLICIGCPMGCPLTVKIDGENVEVSGNTCKRGAQYGQKEVTNPTRIVTTTVRVRGGAAPVVSVKTASDIPKGKIAACVAAVKQICVDAPVKIGDVILPDVAGTGVDIVATKAVEDTIL